MTQEFTEQERARIRVASELRRGMHLLVGRQPTSEEMTALAGELSIIFDRLEATPERIRGALPWQEPTTEVPQPGEAFRDSIDRPISGSGNPFSVPMEIRRDGDCVVSTVTLDSAFEGAPGRSHGGVVAAIFDDLLGSLPMMHEQIAFTASLTVNYVAPSPVFAPVTFRGWIDRFEGKKMFVEGEAHDGDTLVSTASGLFIDATEAIANLYQ